jgi:glycosyltransferase involved in cell wall biosynthesis
MTTLEFRSHAAPFAPTPITTGSDAAAAKKERKSLALVTVADELCGIAAYSHCLKRHLADAFDVTVFDLDQYLLRSMHRAVRQLGDRHIREICRQLKHFDAVNLQLEHGTLGRHGTDIYRRFCWILAAAPRISVTFHTVVPVPTFETAAWLSAAGRLHLPTALRIKSDYLRRRLLSVGMLRRMRRAQRHKHVAVIVHTPYDMQQMKFVHGLREVHHHPLAFLAKPEADEIRSQARRDKFPMLDDVPQQSKLIGIFGFLGPYKGFETVTRAMQHLPKDYHLLIFGGVHPNAIRLREPIDPYVRTLLDSGYVDASIIDRVRTSPDEASLSLSVSSSAALRELLVQHPKDLSARIHFMGALSHSEFLSGMAICDVAVMPYIEVGQSASGPISLALELGCRVLASRTRTFLQFSRYHRDMIEFFDIGNHLELAQRIMARPQFDPRQRVLSFDVETNKAVYVAANDETAPLPAAREPQLASGAGAAG